MTLVGLVVMLVILIVLIWAVQYLTDVFHTPPQIRAIILVAVVVVFVLWLVQALGLGGLELFHR